MNSECDCPICLDTIIGTTNKTTTECGHNFHTKCLMQNAAHNGFGCPYCRNILAELPKLYNDSDSDSDSDDSFIDEYEKNENYILTGLRWFCQRINNEELEVEEENVEVTQNQHDLMAPLEDVNIKFKSSGITYDQLLEYILEDYKNENHRHNLNNNNSYKKVYTELREIDANFRQNLRLSRERERERERESNRNTDYYEDFINEYQIPIRESNNIM